MMDDTEVITWLFVVFVAGMVSFAGGCSCGSKAWKEDGNDRVSRVLNRFAPCTPSAISFKSADQSQPNGIRIESWNCIQSSEGADAGWVRLK